MKGARIVEVGLEFESAPDANEDGPTTGVFVATIRNIGSVDARIADVFVEVGSDRRADCRSQLWGDYQSDSGGLPFTFHFGGW
jgi:hypothetical protein